MALDKNKYAAQAEQLGSGNDSVSRVGNIDGSAVSGMGSVEGKEAVGSSAFGSDVGVLVSSQAQAQVQVTEQTPALPSVANPAPPAQVPAPGQVQADEDEDDDNDDDEEEELESGIDKYKMIDKATDTVIGFSKGILGMLGKKAMRVLKKGYTLVNDVRESHQFKACKHMVSTKTYDCYINEETGEAELTAYRGKKREIVLPTSVKTKNNGTFIITHIKPWFLQYQTLKGVKSIAMSSRILENEIADMGEYTGEIRILKLPEKLVYLPSSVFAHSGHIGTLYIPSTVTRISISAFNSSKIAFIKFYGHCPIGLKDAKLPKGCIVLYKKKYEQEYSFLGNKGRAMKGGKSNA